MKATPLAPDASVQDVVSEEETESNVERGDSNRMYTNNPLGKEDFIEVTSKDQKWKHQGKPQSTNLIAFSPFERSVLQTSFKVS